ncbi:hypothetical protein GXW83_29805 [Streptacidiphilus sp. PB12-B1b]|uniref:hypothetical protein n=1 Tax=Streptacidiphilus sp. PB12-B1b TaxID=2705012 RepID=UPI0015FDDB72|nr:hypothetical protein [Streptacidiphilus sp. PB12-B1b]QMU79279.1 hypothetical protein GXW83_29805 [Streptacidiphilus sp. PB12-B1b]
MTDPQNPRQPQDPRIPPGDAQPADPRQPEPSPPLHQPVWQGYGTPPPTDPARPAQPGVPENPDHTLVMGARPTPQGRPHQQPVQPPAPQPPAQPSAPAAQPGYGYPQPGSPAPGPYLPPYVQPTPPPQALPNQLPAQLGTGPAEPDWSALAAANESRGKRRRVLLTVSGVVVLALVAGGAVYASGALGGSKGKHQQAQGHTTATAAPSPSQTPPAKPTGSAAPTPPAQTGTLTGAGVFSAQTLTVGSTTFTRKLTDTASPCWKATGSGLGTVLNTDHCTQLLRATYISGGVAVTVGIGVFSSRTDSAAAAAHNTGTLDPLYGDNAGVDAFCQKAACAVSHSAYSHFTYYTVAGPTSGAAGAKDGAATTASNDLAAYALTRIKQLVGG